MAEARRKALADESEASCSDDRSQTRQAALSRWGYDRQQRADLGNLDTSEDECSNSQGESLDAEEAWKQQLREVQQFIVPA